MVVPQRSTSPLGGPAVICPGTGYLAWYQYGQLHRVDGPAVIRACGRAGGSEEWYFEGHLHRLDGPAIIRADGTQSWWIHGRIQEQEMPPEVPFDYTPWNLDPLDLFVKG